MRRRVASALATLFFHSDFKVELTILIEEHEVAVTAIFNATFLVAVATVTATEKKSQFTISRNSAW